MFFKYFQSTMHVCRIRGSRSYWARRPSTVLLLGLVWVTICAYFMLKKAHHDTSRYNFHVGGLLPGSRGERTGSVLQTSSSASAGPAGCKAAMLPDPDVVQTRFADSWGHMCVPLRQACYDEGTFVLYHPSNHPKKGGKAPKDPLPLGNNHLEFRDFGDVYGISQYPQIIFRPSNSDEEVVDLQNPSFSDCSRPVVLYLNHLYMFGDFMISTMPTFINAINSGAWNRSHTLVIATGGQKLQPWQKLMLQPLTQDPIVTLSVASSRAVPLLQQQLVGHGAPRRRLLSQKAAHDTAGNSSSSSSGWHQLQDRRPPAAGGPSGGSSSGGDRKGPPPQRSWKQWQQQSYQRQQQQQSAGSALHIPYKQQQQQQLPQQWQQWQQQWKEWKRSAPAVATATAAAAAAVLSQQQQLRHLQRELVHPTPPVTSYGRCFESLTVCSIQQTKSFSRPVSHPVWSGAQYIRSYWADRYGAQYKQLPQALSRQLQQPNTLRVVFAVRGDKRVRSMLNLEELLNWCNAWKPIDQHNALSSKYSQAVCVAHEFGRHGQVHTKPQQQQQQQQQEEEVEDQPAAAMDDPGLMVRLHESLAEAVGTVMGVLSGRHGRQLLEYSSSSSSSHQSSRHLHRANPASSSSSSSTTGQADNHPSSQSVHDVTAFELPLDPELDPRGLLADLAVLDESDVVVGVHGAQLLNALFMAQHKSLVEVRPYQFTGGWPDSYFQQPLVTEDKADGIFWWGVDTTQPQNSMPGFYEQTGTGCCYERDRHTRLEPKSLEYLLRRIIWCDGSREKYQQLHGKSENHVTDTLQQPTVKDTPKQQQQPAAKEHQQQQTANHTQKQQQQHTAKEQQQLPTANDTQKQQQQPTAKEQHQQQQPTTIDTQKQQQQPTAKEQQQQQTAKDTQKQQQHTAEEQRQQQQTANDPQKQQQQQTAKEQQQQQQQEDEEEVVQDDEENLVWQLDGNDDGDGYVAEDEDQL